MKKLFLFTILSSLILSTCFAVTYEEAKTKQFVCEHADGYLRANNAKLSTETDTAQTEVRNMVADKNNARRGIYQGIANENQRPVAEAAAAAATKLMAEASCSCGQADVSCDL